MIFRVLLVFFLILFFNGCERESINQISDDGKPPMTPMQPSVFRARDGEIGIEWQAAEEADLKGYNIYRGINDSINYNFIAFTPDNFFIDDSLEYDTLYYYKISAVDNFERESELSVFVSAQPINFFNPLTPFDIKINARNWGDSLSIYLSWTPSGETDIAGYEIYRSTEKNFTADSSTLHDFTSKYFYLDKKDLALVTPYYYQLKTVDKGGLKSRPTIEVIDILLDRPQIILPANNYTGDYFFEFKIKTVSAPASYKIVLQRNEFFDIFHVIDFSSTQINQEVSVPFTNVSLDTYTKYYWRVIAYSGYSSDPDSYTDLYNFTIVPD